VTFAVVIRQIATPLAGFVLITGSWVAPARADRYRDAQWYLKSLKVAEAQRISRGAGVTVAVIDSGVWAGHPDLQGAVLPGANVLGDGGDGRKDINGHGTQMASIIAARGRSGGRGILGIAPEAKILPVRPDDGPLLVSDAIKWSVDHGAKVINMSFVVLEDGQLADAVKQATASDVVLVAASGNDGQGGFEGEYPAAYPDVLGVGATDRDGKVASFSHHGPQVDIVAPGADIAMADLASSGSYAIGNGTSQAAAVVSGAAALIRSKYPELSAAQVVQRLTSTAVDKGPPGRDDAYGYGELDLMAALTAKPSTEPTTAGPTAADAPPASQPDSGGNGSGIPPIVIIGIGAVVLVGAVVGVFVGVRRSRGS
jgi:type VII secretion-associated serine protease mycosin